MDSHLAELIDRVIRPGRNVASGVYTAIDPELETYLNSRGEYCYAGLDENYSGPADRLLRVSAFGNVGPAENELAAKLFGQQSGASCHDVAGVVVGTFAGWVTDAHSRAQSSSGGITTWLLVELLRSGLVDAVVHMHPGGHGAELYSYHVSRSEDEIRAGSKSRYYPGELGSVLREVRETPGRYAVVGIPSFIYEVRLLQEIDPIYRDRIRYTVGLICGHQKSANYARYLAWRAGIEPSTILSVDFRKKVPGRPASEYSTELLYGDEDSPQVRLVPQDELYGTDWGMGYFKSNFSDFTEDVFNETADIVLGDAWLPEYKQDYRGTNVVLVRNAELLQLVNEGARRGELHLEQLTVERVVASQSALVRQNVEELPYRFEHLRRRVGESTPPARRKSARRLSTSRRRVQRARLRTSRNSHLAYETAVASGDLRVFDRAMRRYNRGYSWAQLLARVERKISLLSATVWPRSAHSER